MQKTNFRAWRVRGESALSITLDSMAVLRSRVLCVSAEALAAMGDSNATNWAVVQKGVPHLIQMLRAPDLAQVDAAVRLPPQPSILHLRRGGAPLHEARVHKH